MKSFIFAKRCAKEVLRDPINVGFGLGFPLGLLFLLTSIQRKIPVDLFEIETLTPGITVFGLSFLSLFAGTLVSKDREISFLQRLYTTPLTPIDFVLGYMLPFLPIALTQTVICYLAAVFLGLSVNVNVLFAIIGIIPIAVFYISFGILCGSVFGVKQVGGICGALWTNLSAWLSGIWFDLNLVGDVFRKIANFLPFVHAVEFEKALLVGDFQQALIHSLPVILYTVITTAAATCLFLRQMRNL